MGSWTFTSCSAAARMSSKNQLFHHEPNGRFKNVSEGSHMDVAAYGMGATAADVNNDGRVDLFFTEYGGVRLFLNRGDGRFEDVTAAAGIDNGRWATAASFLDYDRDGWLGLVIGNYVDYNPTEKCFAATEQPDFCGPHNFPPTASRLYHNRGPSAGPGKVAFEDVTVSSGFAKALGKALGILCADFDGDGWPDIFVADDGVPNRLYINQRNGAFKEEAALRGLAYNAMGATAGNMGIALNDANHDGLFDLFITHLGSRADTLSGLPGVRPGLFQDRTAASGLVNLGRRGTRVLERSLERPFQNLDGAPDPGGPVGVNGAIPAAEERTSRQHTNRVCSRVLARDEQVKESHRD